MVQGHRERGGGGREGVTSGPKLWRPLQFCLGDMK